MNTNETLDTSEIKKINYKNIFQYIYDNKRTSKQNIAHALSLSLPTVSQSLKSLELAGLIRREGFFQSTGGRKAQMIYCEQNAKIAIGVSILQESVQLCAVNLFGTILKEADYPIIFQNTEQYHQSVSKLICNLVDRLPDHSNRILGVGIAIQGLVSSDGKQVVYGPILKNTGSTCELFQRHIPYPCHLIHDTEASATAEFWQNKDPQNAIYLVLNHNLGGALIVNGTIQQGGGIIEHITLVPGGKTCYCGKNGCVEAYCSANSLQQEMGLDFEIFFQQMRAGNKTYQTIWERYLKMLALTIDNMRMLVDCKFMLGGYMQQFLSDQDIELLTGYIYEQSAFPDLPVLFLRSQYGARAAMLGAAIFYIDNHLNDLGQNL